MNIKSILYIGLFTASVGMLAPMSTAQAYGYAPVKQVTIQTAPPAPRYERVPPSRVGYVWTPGYWNWAGRRHVWVPGTWVRARPGYRYHAPRWVRGPRGTWVFHESRWAR